MLSSTVISLSYKDINVFIRPRIDEEQEAAPTTRISFMAFHAM